MVNGRLQKLLQDVLQYARLRAELVELEIDHERGRVGAMLSCSLILALAALTGVQLLAVLLLTLVWETPWRLPMLLALIAAAAIATIAAWRALRRLRLQPARRIAAALVDSEPPAEPAAANPVSESTSAP